MKSSAPNKTMWRVIIAMLIIWFAHFSLVMYISFYQPDNLETVGVFGDSFGAINVLFSGFALVGAVFAIMLQMRELSLQREELQLQRKEMKLTRQEFEVNRYTGAIFTQAELLNQSISNSVGLGKLYSIYEVLYEDFIENESSYGFITSSFSKSKIAIEHEESELAHFVSIHEALRAFFASCYMQIKETENHLGSDDKTDYMLLLIYTNIPAPLGGLIRALYKHKNGYALFEKYFASINKIYYRYFSSSFVSMLTSFGRLEELYRERENLV